MRNFIIAGIGAFLMFSASTTAWAECDCGDATSSEGLVRLRGTLQFSLIDIFKGLPTEQVTYKLANEKGEEIHARLLIELDMDEEEWNDLAKNGHRTQPVSGTYSILDYDLGTQGHQELLARQVPFSCSIQFQGVGEGEGEEGPGIKLTLPLLASDLAALAKKNRENVHANFRDDNERWFGQPEYDLSDMEYQAWSEKNPTWDEEERRVSPRLPGEVWDLEAFGEAEYNPELKIWIPSEQIEGGTEPVPVPHSPKEKLTITLEPFMGTTGPRNCGSKVLAYRAVRHREFVDVPSDTVYVDKPDFAKAIWHDLPDRKEKLQEFFIDESEGFERRGCLEVHIHQVEAFNPGCPHQ